MSVMLGCASLLSICLLSVISVPYAVMLHTFMPAGKLSLLMLHTHTHTHTHSSHALQHLLLVFLAQLLLLATASVCNHVMVACA